MLECGASVAQALLGEESGEGHGGEAPALGGEGGEGAGISSAVEPVVTAAVHVARRMLARG